VTTVVSHFRFGQGVFDRLRIGLLNYTTALGSTNLMVRKSYGLGSQRNAFATSSHRVETNVLFSTPRLGDPFRLSP
jgi:hypothetical protein